MKLKKLFAVLLLSLAPVIFLAGCDDADEGGLKLTDYYLATMEGPWQDAFGLNSNTSMFYKFDDTKMSISFAGEIQEYPDFSQGDLVFIVKITEPGSWNKPVGKYMGVSIVDYVSDTGICDMSTAYSSDEGAINECDTAEQAASTHTNGSSYFGMYGEYEKQ